MTHRFVAFATANLVVLTGAAACNVFQAPVLDKNDSGVVNHSNGGDKGAGGSAGTMGAGGTNGGGTDAGPQAGGTSSTPDADVSSSGGAPSNDDAGTGGAPSGPTDPWWPHSEKITYDPKKPAVTCETAGLPVDGDRVAADPGDSVAPIYLAWNYFRLGAVKDAPDPNHPGLNLLVPDDTAWHSIGFDLDGSCTNSATCAIDDINLVSQKACGANSSTIPFDGDNCIDNSIGNLFYIATTAPSIGEWFGMSEPDWNCELWRGGFSIVFKISNYNGKYNDDAVTIDLYTSIGLKTLPQWSCRTAIDQPLATDWNTHAAWPTKAHWIISQDSISLAADNGTELPDSKWQDNTAFVRGGWLIAHFPDNSWLWFDGERTPVPGFREVMHRSTMAAKLVHNPQSGLWSITDGTLGYVAKPGEMLDGFAQIGFCQNMCGTFNTVRDYLNTYQDALSTDTNAPPETPCDALSYGNVFHAAQISADATDVQPTKPFTTCPQPRHPGAPRQGCTCSADGATCTLPDGGI